MKKIAIALIAVVQFCLPLKAQVQELVEINSSGIKLKGSLMLADQKSDVAALIIAGSGPTDRDGNNQQMKNNSLKMIAELLSNACVSSLRYDKRGIAASADSTFSENEVTFDDFVNDAVNSIEYLRKERKFKKIIVIGHSEGSLIGMIAAKKSGVDGFVSLAGAGFKASDLIRTQLSKQSPIALGYSEPILKKLENAEYADTVPQMLNSLFRKSVQPYLISWFKYDPSFEIAQLSCDVLIVQGKNDVQVGVDNAMALKNAKPNAELFLIDKMNHILKDAPEVFYDNVQTYFDPNLKLNEYLIIKLSEFAKKYSNCIKN